MGKRYSVSKGCLNVGEYYQNIVEALKFCKQEAIFLINDEDLNNFMIFKIMPSLVIARSKGLRIGIVYCGDKQYESHQLHLLGRIGCSISFVNEAPFFGILIDSLNSDHCKLIMKNKRAIGAPFLTTLGPPAFDLIKFSYDNLNLSIKSVKFIIKKRFKPKLTKINDIKRYSQLFKQIRPYNNSNVKFRLGKIDIVQTIPHASRVKKYKIEQAKVIINFFMENGLDLFLPINISLHERANYLYPLNPPIIEKRSTGYHVVDGHSRIYMCRKQNINTIKAIIIEGCEQDFRFPLNKWEEINESSSDDIEKGGNDDDARNIESITHKNVPLIYKIR